jgi:hypothetical protein
MTVSVITSTIGRPELRRCVQSVRENYSDARHFVYVNGPQFHENARETLELFPDVTAFYLPEDTGSYFTGPSMAGVFAAAPFLTSADWILFLDDDNFFEPNHIESMLKLVKENDLQWGYSLRRFVDKRGTVVCDDDWCSLGHYPIIGTNSHLVDNSCYIVSRRLAQRMALAWTAVPIVADRCFLMALMESGTRYGCTGLSTVNYRLGTGTAPDDPEAYLRMAKQARELYPEGFPWRKPAVFGQPIQPAPPPV